MATPFGWDSHAQAGGKQDSSGDDHLYSWLADDDKPGATSVSDSNNYYSSSPSDGSVPGDSLRQRVLGDILHTKQLELRSRQQARFGDDETPDGRREGPAIASRADSVPNVLLVADTTVPPMPRGAEREQVQPQPYQPTNLELTDNNRKEVLRAPLIANQTVEQVRDLGCAQLERLQGPTSASSQWMAQNRPELLAQFNSEQCKYQWTSACDGTVSAVLTSPEGYYRSLTAKGTTTVEIIADPQGRTLFRHASIGSQNTTDKIA